MRNSLLFLLMFNTLPLLAQPVGFRKVENETAFRSGMQKAAAELQSIRADFIQEKVLSMLDDKVVSKGIFLFAKESKLRMEYTSPFEYLMIINGDKVTIRDRQKTNTFSSRSNRLFTIINNIILDCVRGTVLQNKDFKSEIFSGNKKYLIKLTPVKSELKDYFSHLHVYIDMTDFAVQQFDMFEPNGDYTSIRFSNRKDNVEISPAEFTAP
jgi:outer membrane lipoprotein-sorting protein